MKTIQRNKFTFTRTLYELIMQCPVEERNLLVLAIVCYGLDHKETTLPFESYKLFLQAKLELDKSWRLYQNGCSSPESHHRGGAPKGNKNAAKTIPLFLL